MQEQQLAALVGPILSEHGLELDGLDVTALGKRRILRITVDGDGPKGRGPLLDEISAASARISRALDATDDVGNAPYTLEVSSRGVSKPLTEVKHYRRNTGRLVRLWRGDHQTTGRISAVRVDTVTLDVKGKLRDFLLDEVDKAVVQVELNRPISVDDTVEEA